MMKPSERLELRRQLELCRVCAWLATLPPDLRADWVAAIDNLRFPHSAVAAEIRIDQEAAGYRGQEVVADSVRTHRVRGHVLP